VKERHLLRQAKNKGKSTLMKSVGTSESTAGCSSVTSLSPSTIQPDSNDSSSSFQRAMPDLQRSLRNYSNVEKASIIRNRWNNPLELLALGLRENPRNGNDNNLLSEHGKNDFPHNLHHSHQPESPNDPNSNENNFTQSNLIDLLDLTKRT
jgi:hypothetical protein